MEAAAYPAWPVPVLLGLCGALLSALLVLYLQDRRASRDDHKDLFRLIAELSRQGAETSANVLVLLERSGGSVRKDSEPADASG